jgi:uncharacterized protein (DUF58 family)
VLGNFWLLITIVLFLLSLVLHQVPLLLVSLLFLLVAGVSRLWSRYCLSRVEYRRHLSATRVFFGEKVELETEIANRKPLPLPWLEINDEIPEQIPVLKGKTAISYKQNRLVLTHLLPINWYHKVTRRYTIQCSHRGYFSFGPVSLSSGDIFGFFRRRMEKPDVDYLMVYPKIVPVEELGIPSKQLFGEIRTRSHIFQDPILTSGVRDYSFGDSFRRIHWKSSARLNRLQTKVYEPTTTVDLSLFLDVRTVKPPLWGSVPELLELSIMTAVSVANAALAEGFRVGLYVNQSQWFSKEPIRIPPSQHPDQLLHILEALAQVHELEATPVARLIYDESRAIPWGSTIVVVSAAPTENLLDALLAIKRAGRGVALIMVGDYGSAMNISGLPVFNVPEELLWRELEKINIRQGAR